MQWEERVKLQGSDVLTNEIFGARVTLEGGTLIAGCPRHDDVGFERGAVYEFQLGFSNRFCFGDGGEAGCTPCPCGNNAPPGTEGGCTNGSGRSCTLIGSDAASISNDRLRFDVTRAAPSSFAALISGTNRLPGNGPCPPGSGLATSTLDGLRCVGGELIRHGTRATGAFGANLQPWGGELGAPAGGILGESGLSAGETRFFQVFYRELPGEACGTGQNTSNAVAVTFVP